MANPNWVKGKSGNPGGRPKVVAEVKELARKYTEESIKALAEIALDKKANPSARVSAASVLLDRGYGKATQYVEAKVGPLDGLSIDEKRTLLETIATLTGDSEGAEGGTGEVYH